MTIIWKSKWFDQGKYIPQSSLHENFIASVLLSEKKFKMTARFTDLPLFLIQA